MAQVRSLNQENYSQVGGCDAISDPLQEWKNGTRIVSHRIRQAQDDVREVLRVIVADDPVRGAVRFDQGAVKVQRIAASYENSGNDEEKRAARRRSEEEKASVAAESERRKKDDRKKLEADCEGEKSGGKGALVALEENKHTQDSHRGEDTHLPPREGMQERKR